IEDGAMEQVKNLANLPFAFHHIAIMPDCHLGVGIPIGGVLATENVIVPSAVGVDIGCGMCAVKTSLTKISQDQLKKIMGEIRKQIPVGFKHHDKKQDILLMPFDGLNTWQDLPICGQEFNNALTQIGTLGGGNHFIEIQKGSDGHIWIMLHSGSRNLGFKVAEYYDNLATELNKKWYSNIDKSIKLAFLPVDSEEGQAYIREMQYCVDFALANRKLMMSRIIDIFKKVINIDTSFLCDTGNGDSIVNIAHNYASLENHYGKNVWVHRKGATLARKGTIGIIPGSMGTSSYIVEGLGNKESFESCSHGAGRKMGRRQAIQNLNLEEEQNKMKGILGKPRNKEDLQEAPGAYKNIIDVIDNEKDLIKVLVGLKPLAVIKG
ncbi:MAG: RtcB family protein, partial [Candidatus Paceibacterota bacterium]